MIYVPAFPRKKRRATFGQTRQAWFLTGRQLYLSFLFVLPCLPHSRLNFRCCLLVRTREPRTRGHVGSPVLVDKTNGCVPLPAAVFFPCGYTSTHCPEPRFFTAVHLIEFARSPVTRLLVNVRRISSCSAFTSTAPPALTSSERPSPPARSGAKMLPAPLQFRIPQTAPLPPPPSVPSSGSSLSSTGRSESVNSVISPLFVDIGFQNPVPLPVQLRGLLPFVFFRVNINLQFHLKARLRGLVELGITRGFYIAKNGFPHFFRIILEPVCVYLFVGRLLCDQGNFITPTHDNHPPNSKNISSNHRPRGIFAVFGISEVCLCVKDNRPRDRGSPAAASLPSAGVSSGTFTPTRRKSALQASIRSCISSSKAAVFYA